MKLQIESNEKTLIGTLSGRLDTAASAQFAKDMEPLVENADKKIILDCSALEFISSSGLRLFLTIRKASIARGGDVILRHISAEIKQVFTITGFVSLFKFED